MKTCKFIRLMLMRSFFPAIILLLTANTVTIAQSHQLPEDPAYVAVINKRSAKIVDKLAIADSVKYHKIQATIARQYFDLNDIYSARDKTIKDLKTDSTMDKAKRKQAIETATTAARLSADSLHSRYIGRLKKLLNESQVDEVKDGMTYHTMEVTYKGYLLMLPDLTNAQKDQIKTWLVEAREHSMDAGSSEKKHAWFGKYKGRINNYLSAQGYDLKKAGQEWEIRRNAKTTTDK